MFIAGFFADRFGIKEKGEIEIAALLHDLGHLPFSHSFEEYFTGVTGLTHEEAGVRMIRGEKPFSDSSIPGILENIGVDTALVVDILRKGKRSDGISGIISGPVDSDEMDYLRRDSYYCGIPIGSVDYRRVINTVQLYDGRIVIEEKGIPSMELLTVSRIQMYRSVYWHKTCRIAQGMVSNALELLEEKVEQPFTMRDDQLVGILLEDRATKDIMENVLYRKLFKVMHRYPYSQELAASIRDALADSGFERHRYVLDVIPPENFRGSERVKSNISVMKNGREFPMDEVSPLVKSLEETLEGRIIVLSVDQDHAGSLPASLEPANIR
ncbi:MAG: HD domain-containing protein [Candidatus Thermoplasmatota archaeon]|nr:HD domain-containing protein [Candidatus Thermoplasmatota archaeon]MCL5438264.1 HD domain-containing protein [Candidatus Thermoplasmatota archaeon]